MSGCGPVSTSSLVALHLGTVLVSVEECAWGGDIMEDMEDIMDIIQYASKGKMMDTIERFHIYELTSKGLQLNDKLTIQGNPLFETVARHRQLKDNH